MSDLLATETRLATYIEDTFDERTPKNDRRVNPVKSYIYMLNFTNRRKGIDRRRSFLPTL